MLIDRGRMAKRCLLPPRNSFVFVFPRLPFSFDSGLGSKIFEKTLFPSEKNVSLHVFSAQ